MQQTLFWQLGGSEGGFQLLFGGWELIKAAFRQQLPAPPL
jgi:hypothetical protein